MNKKINFQTEPAILIASIITVLEAAVAMLPLFGVPLSAEQSAAIMALVVAIGGAVGAVVTRSIVYAPATVDSIKKEVNYPG